MCGYRLDVALDPYDDSDIAQAEALLRRPLEQRLAELTRTVARLHKLRRGARRAG